MIAPLQNITIAQIEAAADEYCEKYAPALQVTAFHAFVDAVIWAIKVDEGKVKLK
jgi:hypothetical protein